MPSLAAREIIWDYKVANLLYADTFPTRKATELYGRFSPAWFGDGVAADQEEDEQAMDLILILVVCVWKV